MSSLRKKPWNRVNLPVYSISSINSDGKANMHMITYVTSISMQPKRMVCGVYRGTQTLNNVLEQGEFVLQLLSANQFKLTKILGKTSGKKTDKLAYLRKKQLVEDWQEFPILSDALSVLRLSIIEQFDGGDHVGFLCDVIAYKNLQPGEPLTLDILRAHQLIRI
ncbi:MAG: flavin reductase family protein [Chitinophagia bacterium]|jgi:flavin reductase (DIM6/NTAB) family NADH-FMN oxidoreductase RutF